MKQKGKFWEGERTWEQRKVKKSGIIIHYGGIMNISPDDFKEHNENKKEVMEKKMEALKLENINSMWYFIVATLKAVVGRCCQGRGGFEYLRYVGQVGSG